MAELTFVTAIGRLGTVVGDSSDSDTLAEVAWCDSGEVAFIPLLSGTRYSGDQPAMLGNTTVIATLDSQGFLTRSGVRGVSLADLTSTALNPRFVAGQATHRVEFRSLKAGSVPVSFDSYTARFAADTAIDGKCDITLLAPMNAAPAVGVVVGPPGPPGDDGPPGPPGADGQDGVSVVSMTLVSGELFYELSDGTVASAGSILGGGDTTPPTVPGNVRVTSVSTTGFTVEWDASTDDSGILSYRYLLNDGDLDIDEISETTKTFSGLSPDTDYTFQVAARDTEGNLSEYSEVLTVLTDPEIVLDGVSIFGGLPPTETAMSIGVDGDGSLELGHRFYGTRNFTLLGVRLWNPESASSTWLDTPGTMDVYLGGDYTGDGSLPSTITSLGSPVQSLIIPAGRSAGTWTEVALTEPLAITAVSGPASGNDTVALVYQMDGGELYVHSNAGLWTGGGSLEVAKTSTADPTILIAESSLHRNVSNVAVSPEAYYGLDVIVEEV